MMVAAAFTCADKVEVGSSGDGGYMEGLEWKMKGLGRFVGSNDKSLPIGTDLGSRTVAPLRLTKSILYPTRRILTVKDDFVHLFLCVCVDVYVFCAYVCVPEYTGEYSIAFNSGSWAFSEEKLFAKGRCVLFMKRESVIHKHSDFRDTKSQLLRERKRNIWKGNPFQARVKKSSDSESRRPWNGKWIIPGEPRMCNFRSRPGRSLQRFPGGQPHHSLPSFPVNNGVIPNSPLRDFGGVLPGGWTGSNVVRGAPIAMWINNTNGRPGTGRLRPLSVRASIAPFHRVRSEITALPSTP